MPDFRIQTEPDAQIPVEQLLTMFHPNNSQTRTQAEMAAIELSLQEDGFTAEAIIVNPWNNKIVSGHGRVQASWNLGYRGALPVIYRHYESEELHRRAMLRWNRARGHQDPDLERQEVEALLAAFGKEDVQGALAYSDDDLSALLQLAEAPSTNEGADAEPQINKADELLEKWHVKTGDMFALGRHRLICGDCTDRAAVERVMGGERAKLVVTDPPYGVGYADKNKFLNAIAPGNRIQKEIVGDHGSRGDIQNLWENAFRQTFAVMDDGAVIYCFMPQGGDQMMMMMMMMAGIEPRHELIWLKNNHVLGRVDYAYKHEPILYAWKEGGHKFYGDFQTSVIECKRPQKSDLHPTMKPVELIEVLIRNSSLDGEIIYEPFCGSGTAIIACENLNRQCRAIEISPSYCAVILERWATHTGLQPELIGA